MELTDDELSGLSDLLTEELLYGDDEVVYGTTESGAEKNKVLSSIQGKVFNEAKARGLWWAR